MPVFSSRAACLSPSIYAKESYAAWPIKGNFVEIFPALAAWVLAKREFLTANPEAAN
jgi:hypothetical protein